MKKTKTNNNKKQALIEPKLNKDKPINSNSNNINFK